MKNDDKKLPEGPPGQERSITLVVNGVPHDFAEREITYNEVVVLAYGDVTPGPDTLYTVTYTRGHGNKPEGTLAQGGQVNVKNGMVFNVGRTDKS